MSYQLCRGRIGIKTYSCLHSTIGLSPKMMKGSTHTHSTGRGTHLQQDSVITVRWLGPSTKMGVEAGPTLP